MKIRYVVRAAWVCGLALLMSAAAAQGLPASALPVDIQRIVTRGELRVAMPSFDSPPFFYEGPTGLEGIDAEIANGVAQVLGVRLKVLRQAGSFNEVVECVARGEVDMAVGKLSRTLARARYVRFSDPYSTSRHAVLLNRVAFARLARGREFGDVIRHFDGTLGVIQGSSFADQALRSFPQARLVAYRRWEELLEALTRGEVIAAYRDESEMQRLFQQSPALSLSLRVVAFTDTQDSLSVALPYQSQQLLALVNLYLAQHRPSMNAKLESRELRSRP
ncbi:substrate-binding periplasmic protein [Curvibacter delicatus]|jgi:ABC-type amino acid transport substrate-binding protein|uniref:substrate-binding periplasmic protein n=1 Tax=Curvibacter delicatus TaxID=80879 RepID=UPI000831F1A6|nr:transporter substrate-binding domain-containing protein [Curvibacter delicatus]